MDLLKRKQQKPKEQKQKQSKSPNLLQSTVQIQTSQSEKEQYRISNGAFILIILIQTLFVFLSLVNSKTVEQIDRVQRDIKRQEAIILSRNLAEENIRDVLTRTKTLKELEAKKVLFGPKVLGFVGTLPPSVSLIRSFVEENEMSLTVQTNSPLEISLLIASYFNQGFAKEITIISANLNRSLGTFVTTLEVAFQ